MSGTGTASAPVLALSVVLAAAGCAGPGPTTVTASDGPADEETRVVRIAAAADLKFALEDIVPLVEDADEAVRMDITYGSSGTFLTQIENGAPFDLFLSADLAYPERLVDAGLADEADLFPYAVGRLVLWAGADTTTVDPADGLAAVLGSAEVTTISIANPEHAPYGRAAVAAMTEAGVYDEASSRLVLGENIAQAAEFVQSGNADVGIVALSLVLSDPLEDVGRWAEIPLDSYPRLDQGGVILASADDPDAARTVRDTILGPEGSAVLAEYGFSLPGT